MAYSSARSGGFFEFGIKVKPGVALQATYWGDERKREVEIQIDGKTFATQTLDHEHPGEFFDVVYSIPAELIQGKQTVRVKFVPAQEETR